ncbi:MAG: TraB/GumN family protein, partial [Vitreimonas sp.]
IPGPDTVASFQAFIDRHGKLPPGQTLRQRLSRRDATRLERVAGALGFDIAALDAQRPWLTALQLASADLIRSGQSSDHGVEIVLAAEAARTGKRLSTLETLEEQLGVLSNLPPADEAHFLSVTLAEIGASDDMVAEMDRAWAAGDVAALERAFETQWRKAGPAVHAAIILNRNRAWADEIEQRLDGAGRIFVAVGAAHLIGDGSVVELLRSRGITVQGP